MKIQPISSWQNGQEKLGTQFNLTIINDNLFDAASFYYNICTEEVSNLENEVLVVNTYAQQLVQGNLSINGQDYINWGKASDVNLWAYQWAAGQLNLVLIPETV